MEETSTLSPKEVLCKVGKCEKEKVKGRERVYQRLTSLRKEELEKSTRVALWVFLIAIAHGQPHSNKLWNATWRHGYQMT